MLRELARYWWLIATRGILALFAGLMILTVSNEVQPLISIFVGIYILADGVLAALVAIVNKSKHRDRWWLLAEGSVGIVAGSLVLSFPAANEVIAYVSIFIIAAWCFLTGLCEIIFSILQWQALPDKWTLLLGGAFSVVLGILVLINISSHASLIVTMIANYMIIFGVLFIILGFSLRNAEDSY